VSEAEECRRVVPVIDALAPHVRVSVDTVKPAVAEAAVAAGATLVNDISATLWPVAASHGVGWVAMHMKGTPLTMQDDPRYDDVVAEVRSFVLARAREASEGGVGEVWVDPGIGFGKTVDQNLSLLHHLPELAGRAFPVLVGTSRKTFLGRLARADGRPAPAQDRLAGSLSTATWAMLAGAVHGPGPRRGGHGPGGHAGGGDAAGAGLRPTVQVGRHSGAPGETRPSG
jgi:dihydropteroate synthase